MMHRRPADARGLMFPSMAADSPLVEALRGRLAEPLLHLVAASGVRVAVAAGARVFGAGDEVTGLHVVVEGSVRVIREGPSRAVVVHHECAGGVLGEVALFSDGRYPGTAEATEPTTLAFVPAAAVRRAIRTSAAVAEALVGRLATRAREVILRLDRLAHLTIVQRLARFLIDRHDALGHGAISLGMTQASLAEELGTVKESVVRELRALRTMGLIAPAGRGRYRIVDPPRLRAIAGGTSRV